MTHAKLTKKHFHLLRSYRYRPIVHTNPRTTESSLTKVAVQRTFRISASFTVGFPAITSTKTAREHQAQTGELIEAVDLQLLFQFPL